MIFGVPSPTVCYGTIVSVTAVTNTGGNKRFGIQGKDMFGKDATIWSFSQYIRPYVYQEAEVTLTLDEFEPAWQHTGFVNRVAPSATHSFNVGDISFNRSLDEFLAANEGKEAHLEISPVQSDWPKTIHAFLKTKNGTNGISVYTRSGETDSPTPLCDVMRDLDLLSKPLFMRMFHDKLDGATYGTVFVEKDGDVIFGVAPIKSATGGRYTFMQTEIPAEASISMLLMRYDLLNMSGRSTLVFTEIPTKPA